MTKEKNAEIVRREKDCPPSPSDFPWLVYKHGQDQTFYSLSRNCTYVRSVPELVRNKIWNSFHGWLVLSTEDSQYFSIWNPVTFETIRLPPLKLDHLSCIESCVLSSPPGNLDSTVILFDIGIFSIWFCRLDYQKHRWFTHCYKEEIKALINTQEDTDDYLYQPACCDDKVYAMSHLGRMVVRIDIIEPHSLVLKPVIRWPYPKNMVTPCMGTYLFGSPGELFTLYPLYVDFNGRQEVVDIQIYKLEISSMVWERVTSAKDRAFFFSENHGNSCSATCSEDIGNKIYFTRSKDKSLYTHHIEDANLSISLPCPNLPASSEAPIWVVPSTRITSFHGEAIGRTGKEQQASKESEKELEGIEEEMSQTTLKEGKDAKVTHLFDLPFDVLNYIVTGWLILHDYMNFRLVSTLCRKASPPIQWKTTTIRRLETQIENLSPWLMFTQKNGRLCSFLSPQHADRYYFEVPESLTDSRILYCKDGWLLMGKQLDDHHINISFFNPLTKDVIPHEYSIHLPIIDPRFAFSSAPTSSNCVVVIISGFAVICICRLKGEVWEFFDQECDKYFFPSYTNPVHVDGAFYFLGNNGEDHQPILSLGVLRIQREGCDWKVYEQPEKDTLSFSESFLAERNGEIFLVLTGTIGGWVRVFMLDKSTMSWEKVEDLGNYTLYVSRTSSLFTVANSPDTRNMIYLPRLCGEHLVSYSLSTNTLHSAGTTDSLNNYQGTMEPLICCWTKPSWS